MLGNDTHLRGRLRDGGTVLKPSDDSQPATRRPRRRGDAGAHDHAMHREGQPEVLGVVGVGDAGESRRRNADDRERLSIDRHDGVDDARIRGALLRPERMAQHRHGLPASLGVFVREERASDHGPQPQDVEVVPRHEAAEHTQWVARFRPTPRCRRTPARQTRSWPDRGT